MAVRETSGDDLNVRDSLKQKGAHSVSSAPSVENFLNTFFHKFCRDLQ